MRKLLLLVVFLLIVVAGGLYWFKDDIFGTKPQEVQKIVNKEFSKNVLVAKAQKLARKDYVKPESKIPEELLNLSYDQHRDIRFVRDNGPWFGKNLPFEMQFFHVGSIFQMSIPINEVENGKAKPIKYSHDFFDYGKNNLEGLDKENLGYAGFRLHTPINTPRYYDELVSFLGASYFRALGKNQKYGLSARGLAIDTAVQTGEEFPIFKEFWIEKPKGNSKSITVYALLDSPSVAGAYTFVITPGVNTTMEVEASLFPRKKIGKMGVAPLTSMFLFGENTKNRFDDYRPEVHDSDGLLVWNGKDEWLWRPLDNSKYLRISSFVDENPKGFGLMQRDRDPAHYLDFEANYEQRPSLWVEPIGDWGKGMVQLVEIPSVQEIHDNIVAYWVPAEEIKEGKEYNFKYRLNWCNEVPQKNLLARIEATYTGVGGVSGMLESQKRKFVIDFVGSNLKNLFDKEAIVPELSTSEGQIVGHHMIYNPLTKGVTLYMDFIPNNKTAELRASLKSADKTISEVWSYQWLP